MRIGFASKVALIDFESNCQTQAFTMLLFDAITADCKVQSIWKHALVPSQSVVYQQGTAGFGKLFQSFFVAMNWYHYWENYKME